MSASEARCDLIEYMMIEYLMTIPENLKADVLRTDAKNSGQKIFRIKSRSCRGMIEPWKNAMVSLLAKNVSTTPNGSAKLSASGRSVSVQRAKEPAKLQPRARRVFVCPCNGRFCVGKIES